MRPPRRGSATERPQLVRDEAQRRDGRRSRSPGRGAPRRRALHEHGKQPEPCEERDDADDQETRRLVAAAPVVGAERPAAMPDEVVGDGDEEGDRRGDAVVARTSARRRRRRGSRRSRSRPRSAKRSELPPGVGTPQAGANARPEGAHGALHFDRCRFLGHRTIRLVVPAAPRRPFGNPTGAGRSVPGCAIARARSRSSRPAMPGARRRGLRRGSGNHAAASRSDGLGPLPAAGDNGAQTTQRALSGDGRSSSSRAGRTTSAPATASSTSGCATRRLTRRR